MKFKDYYATLGVPRTASQDEIKQAYRKLARKYHPDVSKVADAEVRFKELNEANEALKDPERRAAYDRMGQQYSGGQDFQPPPGWDAASDDLGSRVNSDFFEALFGRGARAAAGRGTGAPVQGQDLRAKVLIDLEDSYRGAQRSMSLNSPADPSGPGAPQQRTLDINIPKGIREGQHMRLAGQGAPGSRGAPAGDLLLEIAFRPHRLFRVDGRDVYFDLPLAPWEAALGATLDVPTPEGPVQLGIPPGSAAGRKLRLKGRGIPGKQPGDLYAVLTVRLPPAETEHSKEAYRALAAANADFDPRADMEG